MIRKANKHRVLGTSNRSAVSARARGGQLIETLESRQLLSGVATTTSLSAPSFHTLINVPVTYTATVAPSISGVTPTGDVTFDYNFDNDSSTAGSQVVPLQSNGTARFTITANKLEYINVTAVYSGDSNLASSTSSGFTVNANTGPATLKETRGNIPDAILTNANTRGVMDVEVTNSSSTRIHEVETVHMFLLGLDAGSSSIEIGSSKRLMNIQPDHSQKVPVSVKLQPADGVAEESQFLCNIVDANGLASISYGVFVNIAAPFVALAVTGAPVHPSTFSTRKTPYTLVITVTDTGNVDAIGTLELSASPFNSTFGVGSLDSTNGVFRTHIKAGKSHTFVLHGKYNGAGTFPVGAFNYDIFATLNGVTGSGEVDGAFTVL